MIFSDTNKISSAAKKLRPTPETEGRPNRIGKGTQLKGDITSDADFRIDGTLEGTIKTSGKVVIGKQGHINGTIECMYADIEGKFTGELLVKNLLSLKASAVVEGTATVGKLAVESGATVNASCTMGRAIAAKASETAPKLHPPKPNGSAKAS